MIRNARCVSVLVLVASLAACENKPVGSSNTTPSSPVGAKVGAFPENPLLAFAPADTPYAFASFRPVPIELIRKTFSMVGPLWRKGIQKALEREAGPEEERRKLREAFEILDQLDVKKFEDYGFSASARVAVYGLGAYPVFRIELKSGDRVYETVRSFAERWGAKLPAPTERGGRRYWIIDVPKAGVFVALAPKELVISVAPRAVIDTNLASLLGEKRPAKALAAAQLRAVAERDGFTGYGVGFLDVARVGAMIVDALELPADCAGAVAQLAQRTPRITAGYGDLSTREMSTGIVVELAPDLLVDVRKLGGSLSGLDALLTQKQRPAMAVAVATDLDQGRAMLGRMAVVMQDLGRRCGDAELVSGWAEAAEVASRPLPSGVAGARGGYVVVNDFKMGPAGPSQIDAVGAVLHDRIGELVKVAESLLPGFKLPLDGKAHALPAGVPYPGSIAASERGIGLAIGANSQAAAVQALGGKPAPAPLGLLAFDYSRLVDIMPAGMQGDEAEMVRALFKGFGLASFKLLVDGRGVVMWSSIELR